YIVLGGEHATACARHILQSCPAVDACVLGEGEHGMVALIECIDSGGEPSQLAGIVARSGRQSPLDGRDLVKSQRRPRIQSLDTIERPAWDLFPIERYI